MCSGYERLRNERIISLATRNDRTSCLAASLHAKYELRNETTRSGVIPHIVVRCVRQIATKLACRTLVKTGISAVKEKGARTDLQTGTTLRASRAINNRKVESFPKMNRYCSCRTDHRARSASAAHPRLDDESNRMLRPVVGCLHVTSYLNLTHNARDQRHRPTCHYSLIACLASSQNINAKMRTTQWRRRIPGLCDDFLDQKSRRNKLAFKLAGRPHVFNRLRSGLNAV